MQICFLYFRNGYFVRGSSYLQVLGSRKFKQVNYSDFVHSCHCCLYGADLCCHLPLNDVQRVTPKVAESRLGDLLYLWLKKITRTSSRANRSFYFLCYIFLCVSIKLTLYWFQQTMLGSQQFPVTILICAECNDTNVCCKTKLSTKFTTWAHFSW